jgi:hypothetical protein
MQSARSRPAQQPQHRSAVSLHFGENFDDTMDTPTPLGNDMRGVINNRRAAAMAEEEKMRRLGIEEYNRQTYGGKKYNVRLGFNDDGLPDNDVMAMINKKFNENNTVSYNTPLDGKLETDVAFLSISGREETFESNGVDNTHIPAKKTTQKPASKEINLKYNKKQEVPLAKTPLTKIRILVEYKEDCADEDKNAVLTLTKVSRGGNEKTVKLNISGEGKVLVGEKNTYFFEHHADGFNELFVNLTGAAATEASIILS